MKIGEKFILPKSETRAFFESLAKEMQLVGPRRYSRTDSTQERTGTSEDGDVMFGPVKPEEIVWDYGHDLFPPKRYLLPQQEDLFAYEMGRLPQVRMLDAPPMQAIVGIRSCDVQAIRMQERFFGSPIVDPYYRARAERTVLFSLVCSKPPRKECFCICCEAGPWLDSGFDVQLTDLGEGFLYEIGSEKGLRVTEPRASMLGAAAPDDLAERKRLQLQADSLFETASYIAKAINFISADEVPEKVWEEIASTCFRCGACTNLCPVCTCFTVDDRREADGTYTRCRIWDSCQFAGFTREASGHNPRPTPGSRLQRRMYHKASYQYIMRDGRHGCVGCGRCIAGCLADLGLPAILKRVRRAMHEYLQPVESRE